MKLVEKRAQYRESLRQEILDAARDLFVKEGYDATSIRKIADRIGASSGILYHYFEDKPAIMAQLVAEAFAQLSQRLQSIADDQAAHPLDRLRRSGLAYIRFGIDNPHQYAVLFMKTEAVQQEPKIMEVFMFNGMKCFGALQQIVNDCHAGGHLRPELTDPVEVAQSIWAHVHGLASVFISAKTFPFVEQTRLIERHVEIAVAGVRRHA